jgi:hypothetical protein
MVTGEIFDSMVFMRLMQLYSHRTLLSWENDFLL